MKTRLSLFIKAPILDEVKTRLAQAVGPRRALEIYKSLIEIALNNSSNINGIETELCVLGDLNNPDICRWAESFNLHTRTQQGEDLGERMFAALDHSIRAGYRALLIGGDCPELDGDYIRKGVVALDGADVVFGPVEDGGYALVGMSESCAAIFTDIPWSSSRVLKDSIVAAENAGLKVALLETLWDVDYLEDWNRVLALSASKNISLRAGR